MTNNQFYLIDQEELERKLIEEESFSNKNIALVDWNDESHSQTEEVIYLDQFGIVELPKVDFLEDAAQYRWNVTKDLVEQAEAGDQKAKFLLKKREFRRLFAIINYSGKTFVFSKTSKGELELQDFKSFKEFHLHEWYEWPVEDNKGKHRKKKFFVADEFLKDKFVRRYEGMEFSPDEGSTNFINLWKGWNVIGRPGPIPMFHELIRSLCNYEETAYEYLLNYLAHMVQNTTVKPEVAVVMRGAQGIGKGTLMKIISKFNDNFKHLSSSQSLSGQFSGHLMDAYVVFADESFFGGDKASEGRLKALITEDKVSIRAMRKDEIQVRSYIRLFVASNESWAVPVGEGDRRFFVVDCSEKYKGHTGTNQFFGQMNQWLSTRQSIENIFHFLQHRNIAKFNPRIFPKTKARTDMQKMSLNTAPKFLYEMLNGTAAMDDDTMKIIGIKRRFSRNKLYADLLAWCKEQNIKYVPTTDEFGKTISKNLNFVEDNPNWKTSWSAKVNGKNEYFYMINSMANAQERFAKAIFDCPPEDVFFNYPTHKEEEGCHKE